MNNQEARKLMQVLLVEDNPGDAELMILAMSDGQVMSNVSVAGDGIQALEFLHRVHPHEKAPRPDLIVLDLNLPRKDGRETLSEIKQDPKLSSIPVVIMTTSEAEVDVVGSYRLHANCYIKKPADLDQFTLLVKAIEEFWFETVILPTSTLVEVA